MSWHGAYTNISEHVFRIETPDGSGTGFVFGYNKNKRLVGIATAAHVVSECAKWRKPLRLTDENTRESKYIPPDLPVILIDERRDSASIVLPVAGLEDFASRLPAETLPIVAPDKYIKIGVPIGWVGYPAVANQHLCFFQGHVSAWDGKADAYLIDGVAINGVSGGPVFVEHDSAVRILGIVSAYIPNRQYGELLPGLAQAQDVSRLHETLSQFKSLDDAAEKRAEAELAATMAGATSGEAPAKGTPEPLPARDRP